MPSAWTRRSGPGPWLGLLLAAAGCADDPVPADDDSSSGSNLDSSTTDAPESTSGTSGSSDGLDSTAESGSTGDPPPPPVDPIPDPPGLAAHAFGTCMVADDGTMRCWGDTGCGLPNGVTRPQPPVPIEGGLPWASVSAGSGHGCAIAEDRSLWCWGAGSHGRVGDGIYDPEALVQPCRTRPVEVAPGHAWARLSLGDEHSCGVQTDGTLWCWGSNESGQIGDGALSDSYDRYAPVEVGGLWTDVYAGRDHTCALDPSGTPWCWGLGGHGQLGQDGVSFSSVPLEVPGAPPLRELATGGTSATTCGLAMDGAAWCWGANEAGSAGVGTEEPVLAPTALELDPPLVELHLAASTACARADDGRLWCWGSGSSGQLGDGQATPGHGSTVPLAVEGDDWTDVALGASHRCGQRADGTTQCIGRNSAGQLGDGTSGPDNHRLSLVEVGPWGGGPVATDWAEVELGGTHGCGLRLDGSLWCWGGRNRGQLGNDDPLDDCSPANPTACAFTTPVEAAAAGAAAWQSLALGGRYGCATQTDGTLWCWGANESGQLGTGGDAAPVPTRVEDATDWTLVRAGDAWTCGLRDPGTLWCWGRNDVGQLGLGITGGSETAPVQVGVETDWIDVALGDGDHACGIRSGGTLWCWGRNDVGQLGLGMEGDPQPTPTAVPGSWASVAIGTRHTCALATDGSLSCWGSGQSGALGVGPVAEGQTFPAPTAVGARTDWVQVVTGTAFTCGRRSDGTAWCWGSNDLGELGQGDTRPASASDVPVQVGTATDWDDLRAHGRSVCGRRDATVWCWGANGYGTLGNDTIFVDGLPREVRDDG